MKTSRQSLEKVRYCAPDTTGEEGRVWFVGGDADDQYAVKEWYGQHRLRNIEFHGQGRLALSPFFVRKHFYEASIIHDLFPDNTIQIVGAVDERLSQTADGEIRFNSVGPLPLTVSRRIVGDPALQGQCEAITKIAYETLLAAHAAHPTGIHDGAVRTQVRVAVMTADEKMRGLLGKELTNPVEYLTRPDFMLPDPSQVVDHMLEGARRINPRSMIVDMLKVGVVPIHPEFNIIPGRPEQFSRPPRGTFVELHVLDPDRLLVKLNNDRRYTRNASRRVTATQWLRKFERFRTFQELDNDYYHALINRPQTIIDDPAVQQALFLTLQAKLEYQHYLDTPGKALAFQEKFGKEMWDKNLTADNLVHQLQSVREDIVAETASVYIEYWLQHIVLDTTTKRSRRFLNLAQRLRQATNRAKLPLMRHKTLRGNFQKLRQTQPSTAEFLTQFERLVEGVEQLV